MTRSTDARYLALPASYDAEMAIMALRASKQIPRTSAVNVAYFRPERRQSGCKMTVPHS
jgi:hypothetical protein